MCAKNAIQKVKGTEIVATNHVWHIIEQEHGNGNLTTVCSYYLMESQYKNREQFNETTVSATHLCHHCMRQLRD